MFVQRDSTVQPYQSPKFKEENQLFLVYLSLKYQMFKIHNLKNKQVLVFYLWCWGRISESLTWPTWTKKCCKLHLIHPFCTMMYSSMLLKSPTSVYILLIAPTAPKRRCVKPLPLGLIWGSVGNLVNRSETQGLRTKRGYAIHRLMGLAAITRCATLISLLGRVLGFRPEALCPRQLALHA